MKIPTLNFDQFQQKHPSIKLYVFDVDHTITSSSTGIRFAIEGFKRGFVRKRTILSFPFRYLNYRLGKYGVDDVPEEFKDLKGRTAAELRACADDVFAKSIRKDVFPKAEQFFRAAKAAGIRSILSSSSFDFIIRPLSDWLAADACRATSLYFNDQGVCTGELSGIANYSNGKIHGVTEEITSLGLTMDQVAFFSDSINDLPLLELVGAPVPTNPDRRLTRASRDRGWPVYSFE